MQMDFHYYATYSAAYLAGYSHEESVAIATGAQLVDLCSVTFLKSIGGPLSAATTQLQLEMMELKLDTVSIQNIVRIWASFHFLPYDLYAEFPKKRTKAYMNKYRLICKPNGDLIVDTVQLAKNKGCEAVGLAMHVLADTWAHSYFAGVPSLVINNTNFQFMEILPEGDRYVKFVHNPTASDDIQSSKYTNSLYQSTEFSVMNLGHGRAGHLPDYSFARYRYVPAWGDYMEIVKDNPKEYYNAFGQMVYAMKYIKGDEPLFEKDRYAKEVDRWKNEIFEILEKRQLIACDDWKAFGEKLSGEVIPDFDISSYEEEYKNASKEMKNATYLGRFFLAALSQKSMVTNRIFKSKNNLAGFPVEYRENGLKGIKDFFKLAENAKGDRN